MQGKAAFLYGINDIRVEEYLLPEIRENQVLLRLYKASLCPTDIKKYRGEKSDVSEGLLKEGRYILGHEAAGVIEKTGKGVTGYKVGDRVAVQPMIPCGDCVYCRSGKSHLCLNLLGVGGAAGNFASCIKLMKEAGIGGCFSTHLIVPEQGIIPIPNEISFEAASLIEPLADAVHSIDAANVQIDDSVVIMGLGPMGLLHVAVARYNGIKNIVGIDLDEKRLHVANILGASVLINPKEKDPVPAVREHTNGLGANKVFVTVGGKAQGACSAEAMEMVAKEGTVSLFASAAQTEDILTVSMNQIHYQMIHLTGTVGFRMKDGNKAVRILSDGGLDYAMIRNYEVPLEEINKAMDLYGKGEVLKVGIDLLEVSNRRAK